MQSARARGHRSRAWATVAGAVLAVAAAGCGPTTPSETGCKAKLLPGDLVITEVFADFKAVPGGMGGDAGKEWLEIYNAKGQAIDLEGLTITSSRPDGSASNTHAMAAAMIAPGQFFTLGNAERGATPPYIDYGYGGDLGDLFNSGGGKLTLSCDDIEIDSAVYDDVREGHARELSAAEPPDYTRNDSRDAWCEAIDSELETGNFGTPGAASDCAPLAVGRCDDGGTMRAVVSPGPGDLVITEVMPSPMRAADATGEWFEAKVMADVDLNGVGLDRAGDHDVKPDVIEGAPCVRVTTGSYVVFARSTDAGLNGGLPAAAIAGLFKFAIVPGATMPGDVAIVVGNTVIDAVRWTRSTGGKSLQLDPRRIDATANDDESNFCNATQPYGRRRARRTSAPRARRTRHARPCPAPGCATTASGSARSSGRPRASS